MNQTAALERRPKPPGLIGGALRVASVAPLQVLRGKRLIALLLLALAPTFLVLLMRIDGGSRGLGVRTFVDMVTILDLSGIFPLTLLFLGAAAVGDDVENGTILYFRLRPLPRASIVVGRYLACVLSATVLLAPAVTLQYTLQVGYRGMAALTESLPILLTLLGGVVLASMAYGALFLLMSLLFRRAVLIGLGFAIGWEALVSAVIPSNAALFTVSFHVRSLLWQTTSEGIELRGIMRNFEEAELIPTATTSVVGLLTASVVLVLLACLVFSRKEFMEKAGDA